MRVIALVALVCAASAAEIGSFASWSETYTAKAATVGATALNEKVLSVTEPTTGTDAQKLWRWYRNVGAAEQAKAKAVMDEAAPPAAPSNAIIVANFKTEYDKEVKRTAADPLVAAKASDGILTMYDVLGETKPTTAQSVPLWTTYRSFNADVRDQVKKDIVRAPFIKLFADALAVAKANAGMTTFATATAFVAGTQGTAAPGTVVLGRDTALVFKAFKAEDRAELNALLVPMLKAFQAKV